MTRDVVVLLGSRWAGLEQVSTRWHNVIRRWAADDRIGRLTVVDFPRFTPGRAQIEAVESWLPGVEALSLSVPLARRWPTPLDAAGWRIAARTLAGTWAGHTPPVVVATTPLWTGLLSALAGTAPTGFDGYDDWRALPSMAAARRRVVAGYRAVSAVDTVSWGSAAMAARMKAQLGLDGTVVPNGADVAAFGSPDPGEEVPAAVQQLDRFAVYAGVVQERVDLDLLERTAAVMPTVVAGPMPPETRDRLSRAGVVCLGPMRPQHLPALFAQASVALLPHVVDDLTTSMDPIKLYEYLASGLPVVATPVVDPELPGVEVADRNQWASAVVGQAERGRRTPTRDIRDWDQVADELLAVHVLADRAEMEVA
jgi:glycosyltransferase involved in cell wall biosynthesis